MKLFVILCLVAAAFGMPKRSRKWDSECGYSQYEDSGIEQGQESYIVGGWETRPQELPYQLVLIWRGSFICGGVLIAPGIGLTAAHCTDGDPASDFGIQAGVHLRSSSPGSETRDINSYIQHENYDVTGNIENDIAILFFDDVSVGDSAYPACQPGYSGSDYDDYAGQTSTISGWGTTSSGGSVTNELRYVNIGITTYDFCMSRFPNGWVEDGMMCADGSAQGRDSCQGDSGGPLAVKNGQGLWECVGLVSWGIGCAGATPGVYTYVPYYLDWIDSNLP